MRAILILTFLLTAAFGWVWFHHIPQAVERSVAQKLEPLGLKPTIIAKKAQHNSGSFRLENLTFDADGFTRLDTFEVQYSPFSYITSGRTKQVLLAGLDLYADLDEDFGIQFIGVKDPLQFFEDMKNIDDFEIRDAQITLNSKTLGAVILGFETQGSVKDAQMTLRTNAYMSHKNMRLKGSGSGVISNQNWWHHDFEIEQASLKTDALEFKRASGSVRLSGETLNEMILEGSFRSDGMIAVGQPWKSASISLSGSLGTTELLLSGKHGLETVLELNVSLPEVQQPINFSGSVYSDDYPTLERFLKTQNLIPVSDAFLEEQRPEGASNVEFYKSNQDISILWSDSTKPNTAVTPLILTDILKPPSPLQFSAKMGDSQLKDGTLALGTFRIRDVEAQEGKKDSESCTVIGFSFDHTCLISFEWGDTPKLSSILISGAFGEALISSSNLKARSLDILFQDLDLKAFLQKYNFSGWSGNGRFKGAARIEHVNNQDRIAKIELNSMNAGQLSIRNQTFLKYLTASEEERDLIIMSLGNLEYDKLKLSAQNIEGGLFRIQISATGSNPSLMQGRKFALDFDFNAPLTAIFDIMKP